MRVRLLVLAAVLICPLRAETPTAPIPLKKFFGAPNVLYPQLSPDGTKIAFLTPVEKRMGIALLDLKKGNAEVIVHPTDESIANFFWKGNQHLVFYADVGGNESFFIGSTDLTGRRIKRLAESQKWKDRTVGTTAGIADRLPSDPNNIMLQGAILPNGDQSMAVSASRDLLKVNVETGNKASVYQFDSSELAVIVDNTGRARLREKIVDSTVIWELRGAEGSAFHTIEKFPFHGYAEEWEPLVFASDNETLYVISRREHDRGALYAYNTTTEKLGPAIFVPPEGEITELPLAGNEDTQPILSADRSKLYGVAYEAEKLQYHWIDPEEAKVETKLERTFPGHIVEVVSRSADEQVEILLVRSDRDPGTYYIFDRKAGGIALLRRVRDLDPEQLRPVRPVTFAARDGLELHGYLTLPAGAEGRRVPLIIHPHGGPYGIRDSWRYDGEVQFLASRGYAVLQVNYRGSGGYGREFINKGRYQWGRAMQDDLTDAVHWAIAQGIADPARVAIYGASYGGYAALAGVTLTPDLYCCAVNYVGAADLTITFAADSAYHHEFDYQKTWVGPDRAYLEATSPIELVDRIRVPTLHAYGDNDPRVKIKHWHRLESELKKHDKTYESNEQPNQGHGFHNVEAAQNFYEAMEKFFAKYLAPERPAETARLLAAGAVNK
ncbi:MAG TPA: S9 family peptidase [Opitutus sp.]|nr:S9 family peptidase [Opitutus sp.]